MPDGNSTLLTRQHARLQLNEASARRDGNRLRAIARAQFLHDALHVDFNGRFRDEQLLSDVPVAVSQGRLPQDVDFSVRQFFIAESRLRKD
jgi:hypothetical protein